MLDPEYLEAFDPKVEELLDISQIIQLNIDHIYVSMTPILKLNENAGKQAQQMLMKIKESSAQTQCSNMFDISTENSLINHGQGHVLQLIESDGGSVADIGNFNLINNKTPNNIIINNDSLLNSSRTLHSSI